MRAIGGADLALVLAPELAEDAAAFSPKRIAVVTNGLADPGPVPDRSPNPRCELLFLGSGDVEKGLFDLVDAVGILGARRPGSFRLTFAGSFPSTKEQRLFKERSGRLGELVRHVGFANELQKRALLSGSDVFCLPTRYRHEGQPLALVEALAYDLRIVTTRWRAIPGMMPPVGAWFAAAGSPVDLAAAIESAAAAPAPNGTSRSHYLGHFTLGHHLSALKSALGSPPT
jgi:glycosyltransferase involved in cell wall biosynthesis